MLPLGFTKAIFYLCCRFFSGIGVVFLTSPEPSSAVLALCVDGSLSHSFLPLCVGFTGLFARFCHKMTFYEPGEYDHSVLYATAQLTEGRSARDQPKQPQKKKGHRTVGSHLLPCCLGQALRSSVWRRAPLAGTGVRFQAFHCVPKHLSHWDTKSAQELEVFLCMSRERLRLCCGIQCAESLHPNGPRQRRKLFTAALKLLRFAIGIETVCCENEEQRALHAALLPLLRLEDGHVLATLSAIVLPCVKDVPD